jgi:pimeloyl-ACP methyl ester carboxylesterase
VVPAGVSMGGYVAMAMARRHPGRVAGLALIDTKADADAPEARANRERIAAAVTGDAGTRALAPMLDTLIGASSHAARPEVVRRVREQLAAAPPAGVAWSQRAMAARPDCWQLLAGLEVPVAVLVGEEDVLTPPSAAAAMAAGTRDAVLGVLPRAGHLTPLEAPAAVAEALLALVLRVGPGPGRGA